MQLLLPLDFPKHFHYEHTIYSHGWCALSPFTLHEHTLQLDRVIALPGHRIATLRFTPAGRYGMQCLLDVDGKPRSTDEAVARKHVEHIFHLTLDLRPFHTRIAHDTRFSWMAKARAGRMLRCPNFFEDVIKMVLTTNCSWSSTTRMTAKLVQLLGRSGRDGTQAFPEADAIADCSETFLRTEAKLGYRAAYILAFSRRIVSGTYDIEEFRTSSASSTELYRELLGFEGVGPYAAANLLKLLGRFDYLGLDSWSRAAFSRLHGNGMTVSDADIESFYARHEEWKGLVMWLDVTRHWYTEKFPRLDDV